MTTAAYVEVRPNIKACNFFLKIDVPRESSPTVKIGATSVEVDNTTLGFVRLELPSCITLVPESLSGLSYSLFSICFRAEIDNFDATNGVHHSPASYDFGVRKNEEVRLICVICREYLSDVISFRRILPLPSTEEFNDFFCHRHSSNDVRLEPEVSDLFYNYFFFKVHVQNLQIAGDVNHLICPKCSTHHGDVSTTSAKLWSSTVCVCPIPFNQELPCAAETFLKSFAYFIKDLPKQMNKFVFKCASNELPTSYVLVWVLERSLTLVSGEYCGNQTILLNQGNVMKILHRHFKETNSEVKEWLNSFSSSVIPISPQVELELLQYLVNTSDRIPCDSNNVNGMSMAYLPSK